jgi:hypothetical protein
MLERRRAMSFAEPTRSRKSIIMAAVGTSAAGLVSSVHHWYGAIVYDTTWRLLVSLWIPAFVSLVCFMLYLHWKYVDTMVGKIAVWVVLFAGVIFQIGFTLFECAYSHILKNILFFGGAAESTLSQLFPEPAYHLPDNAYFEFTGVLQIIGLWAAWLVYRVFKERSKRRARFVA